MSPSAVVILMICLFVVIIGVDVYLALDKVKENTFSAVLREKAKKWLPLVILICYGMGLLTGHWFWGSCPPPCS